MNHNERQKDLEQRNAHEHSDGPSRAAQSTGPIISHSPQLQAVLRRIESVASYRVPVLITGETGSGKGLMASTLFQLSSRSERPFMQLNCSALQEQLLESELFGHRKGSFTGAAKNKLGLFDVLDGGTMFLDEIGEMSAPIQAKLLQVLDTGELRPLGGTRPHTVDVRIIAATNRNLKREVRAGRFRQDLYYRLNVVQIRVPPLRERKEDIAGLVAHYLGRFATESTRVKEVSQRALDYLQDYPWPGNVRELANVMETLVLLSTGDVIRPEDLPPNILSGGEADSGLFDRPQVLMSLKEVERRHILRILNFTGGLKGRAARILRVDVKTLNRKIKAYSIDVTKWRP